MRKPLVRDAIRMAHLAYWNKDKLESFVTEDTIVIETKNVILETSNISIETSNVSVDIDNVSIETSNVSVDIANVSVETSNVSVDIANVSVETSNVSVDIDNVSVEIEEYIPYYKIANERVRSKLEKPIKFYSSPEDAKCYVTQYESGLCMVFRGTTNIRDWMTNINTLQQPLNIPNIFGSERPLVHSGFLSQFNSLMMTLMQHAVAYMADNSIKESQKTIYYIGHSLGGALATIAALVFGAMYPDARHVCITFGSPRVGNYKFVELFQHHVDESVRCVNQEDPVPLVPSACRYDHVYQLYIDKNHTIQSSQTENRLFNACKDSMLCWCGLAENPIDDHATEQYEDAWKNI